MSESACATLQTVKYGKQNLLSITTKTRNVVEINESHGQSHEISLAL
jgi:hypothetical protein